MEVSINLQDLMDWLCGHLLGPEQYGHQALPYTPTAGILIPTPKMTHSQVKGNLVFHRPHFDGKTNAYYNNKNTILKETAQGELALPILLWLGGGSDGCLRLKGGSEMNLQSNSS